MTCLLEDQSEEDLFRAYMGQAIWMINSIQHLKTTSENPMPQYIEIVHPETKPKEMSAAEIKQHIIERLMA